MKKIINKKMYNTDTAKFIEEYSYSNPRDLNYFYEALYRKKTGEFFINGASGANGKYAERLDTNTWCGGEEIIPLTEKEAKEWLEKYSDTDTYIDVFGEPEK